MKAAVISLGSESSLMIVEALKKYFDEVDNIQLKNIEVKLGKEGGILYEGEELPYYDCVYLKGSFRFANLLRSISSLLENKVPYMPIPSTAFTTVHNKLLTHLVLEQHSIAMPKTYISSTIDAAKKLLEKVNYPIVMKFPEGTQGKGVMFADSKESAASMLDALEALNQPFIIQEYVETGGTDIRALVVGEKVVAAMKRQAKPGEKRSNTHSGGIPQKVELSREAINLALKTAKALQAQICGIDILEGPLGPAIIEANISPGLRGIGSVSTVDIPDQIARFLYDKTKEVVQSKNKEATNKAMKEIAADPKTEQEIISPLQFRGEKIILPPFVSQISGFDEHKEYSIKVKKGKLEVVEFSM